MPVEAERIPRHGPRRILIVDLERLGAVFYEALKNFLNQSPNYAQSVGWTLRNIYDGIMTDLVRLMHLPNYEAIEYLKSFPNTTTLNCVILSLDPADYPFLVQIIQLHVLGIYVLVKRQLDDPTVVEYIPNQVGIDFLMVTEAVVVGYDDFVPRLVD